MRSSLYPADYRFLSATPVRDKLVESRFRTAGAIDRDPIAITITVTSIPSARVPMIVLILGLLMFLGIHSVRMLASEWRSAQILRWGEMPWKGLYSVVSLVGFGLIIWGYGLARAEPIVLWLPPLWTRPVAGVLTLISFILLVATYLPGTRIKAAVGHPMVLGVKAWALAHLICNGNLADLLLFGSFLAWAVADFISFRRRDRATGQTYPALGLSRDALAVAIGLAVWFGFARVGHAWLIGMSPFA